MCTPYIHAMIRYAAMILVLLGPVSFALRAQVRMNEASAKEAVYRVTSHSGLAPNFKVVEDGKVRTAVAYIKGRERLIAYNPDFISLIVDSTRTDLAAMSILAHEIAHHLLGHTLDPDAVHPGDELACDLYSGFIMQRLGARLDEAVAAMKVAGDVHGTERHPPRHARVAAIEQGWNEADKLCRGTPSEPFRVDRDLRYVVRLVGDANTYFVDANGCLVWFDTQARPIEFGACTVLPSGQFRYEITWQQQRFLVDTHNAIWRPGVHGMPLQVGRMEPYSRAQH